MAECTPSPFAFTSTSEIPEPEFLWKEDEGKSSKTPYEESSREGKVLNRFISLITAAQLYYYPAPQNAQRTRRAAIVFPGGGYAGNAIDKEGHEMARFFNAQGITAFVATYRDPAPNGVKGELPHAPLADALRAIRLVRSRAEQYQIDADKIGVMGFSSGGHLCLTASTLYDYLPDPDSELNKISARPDFSMPIYPVVSFVETYQHRGSVLRLLGPESTMEDLIRFSPERQVNAQTPPTFMVHAENDGAVPCFNSLNYYKALVEAGVPAELHIYPKGGHGFGMYKNSLSTDAWPEALANWLRYL